MAVNSMHRTVRNWKAIVPALILATAALACSAYNVTMGAQSDSDNVCAPFTTSPESGGFTIDTTCGPTNGGTEVKVTPPAILTATSK